MTMSKYKLNQKASIFHDPSTGILVTKGEEVEITKQQAQTYRIKEAIKGKHLIMVEEETFQEEDEEEIVSGKISDQEKIDQLSIKTISQILEQYAYMNEEDLKEAKSKSKADMIEFLVQVEKEYE